jgi:hypothetical protein
LFSPQQPKSTRNIPLDIIEDSIWEAKVYNQQTVKKSERPECLEKDKKQRTGMDAFVMRGVVRVWAD